MCPSQLTGPAGVNQLLRVSGTQKTPNFINTAIIWNVFYIHFMCVFGSVAGVVLELNKAHAESGHGCVKASKYENGSSNLVSQISFSFEERLYNDDLYIFTVEK